MKFDASKLEAYFKLWPDFNETLNKLLVQHSIAVEGLTQDQTVNCIKQMIAAGDFTRYVRTDIHAQTIVYEPYSRCMNLEMEVERLKKQLALLTTELDKHNEDHYV